MKRVITRYLLIFSLLLPFTPVPSFAQDLTGIWKGYFITDAGEYYKLEFQVVQSGSFSVTGVSYSYLDVRFYGKATMTGSFIKSTSSFRIREIKTVEVKSTMGGGTCIMNYNFNYSRSGKEEFLEGTYLGKFENKFSSVATGRWGDCGGGKVFLRKVNTTDFYIEPFLKNKIRTRPVIVNQPPLKSDSITAKVVNPPASNPPVNKTTVNKPTVTKPLAKTNTTKTTPTKTNTAKNNTVKVITPSNPKPLQKPTNPVISNNDSANSKVTISPVPKNRPQVAAPTPSVIKNRSNELVKILMVHDPDVVVKLYDNGEIDGDTISVYLDKKLILASKMLTASPLTIHLKMEGDEDEHELTMVAENLGRIPPNTSLMVVEAGEQRFDVRITSTEQKNAVVKFKYQKP